MPGPTYSAKELLDRLISFDTTSHKTNLPLIRFVEDYLAQHGLASSLTFNEERDKANLYATIGPQDIGGIGLSGHTDVVPVAGQNWDTDPFRMTERDGRIYGRGTTDMKGFLACVLAAVPMLQSRRLSKPVHILFSYDEEIGCTGVRPMIARLGNDLIKPEMVIVGEPTGMRVVTAHKGPVRWDVDVHGRAVHSSMAPLGVNAISYAGRLLGELAAIEEHLANTSRDTRFDPPYSTLQVTLIKGGTATNIVPVSCNFGFEVRALPGLHTNAIEQRVKDYASRLLAPMHAVAKEAGISIQQTNCVPPFAVDADSPVVSLALELAESNHTHAVSYATEAGLFQDAGTPSVVCGPGDIAQAHTANEWIEASELDRCMEFLGRLADRLSA
ncbi:acetylornithine deacetylase [Filomicrobium insigne]|uniref:Probable succinyl-diaminopimelate desuccinylase n=1 Tax=Filomicrobium insigne TaxID=418854 RepID=A0A1H0IK73_9HYPH|nr:acetylornithine deacetylase [Filomicrobium insigne]SDO31451.1 acetylornithine deacetylase [Filomicrobium insigne]